MLYYSSPSKLIHKPNGNGEMCSRSTLKSEAKRPKERCESRRERAKLMGDSLSFHLLGAHLGLISETQKRRRKLRCPAVMAHMCLTPGHAWSLFQDKIVYCS